MRTLLCFLFCAVATAVHAQNLTGPGKPHELLRRAAGTWECDIKMFFRGPDAPPTQFKGVETNTLVSGDLYLQTTFKFSMGDRGEFEGHSLIGYDPRIKKYVGTWVDNFTTVPSHVEGEYDEEAQTLTVERVAVDGGGREQKSREVTTWLDESTKQLEIFLVVDAAGKETLVKLLEMTAKKRE